MHEIRVLIVDDHRPRVSQAVWNLRTKCQPCGLGRYPQRSFRRGDLRWHRSRGSEPHSPRRSTAVRQCGRQPVARYPVTNERWAYAAAPSLRNRLFSAVSSLCSAALSSMVVKDASAIASDVPVQRRSMSPFRQRQTRRESLV